MWELSAKRHLGGAATVAEEKVREKGEEGGSEKVIDNEGRESESKRRGETKKECISKN